MAANRRTARAALAVLCVAIAACGQGSPSSTAVPAGTLVAAERTPGPSAAPELAAMLPDSAAGIELVKSSYTGNDVSSLGISLDEGVLQSLASGAGKTLADVQVAEARPRDASKSGIVIAIRVPGADPKKVVDATFSESKALQLATIGGKSVYNVGASGLGVVVYLKDDVMFQVVGAPKDLTEAIVAALP
jgi:hypothetical protein